MKTPYVRVRVEWMVRDDEGTTHTLVARAIRCVEGLPLTLVMELVAGVIADPKKYPVELWERDNVTANGEAKLKELTDAETHKKLLRAARRGRSRWH